MFFGIPRDEIYERDNTIPKRIVSPTTKEVVIFSEDGLDHFDKGDLSFHWVKCADFWDMTYNKTNLDSKTIQ